MRNLVFVITALIFAFVLIGCPQVANNDTNLSKDDYTISSTPEKEKESINITSLDEEVVRSALKKSDERVGNYSDWNLNISGKRLVERDGKEMFYVDVWAYKGEWETVVHLSLYMNREGEIEDFHLNPYIKTVTARTISGEEREKIVSFTLNNSRVRDVIANREYKVHRVAKYINIFTEKEVNGKKVYIDIKDSPETYVVRINDNISVENTTCPSGKGFCYFEDERN